MLVPLAGLLVACAIFACIGAALLAVVPRLRLTFANVGLFVIGAVPSCAVTAVAYGRVFGHVNGELRQPATRNNGQQSSAYSSDQQNVKQTKQPGNRDRLDPSSDAAW